MSIPKSVIKIKKSGVEYVSSCNKCQYYIYELTRAALRDVGKFVCRKFRESYYSVFKRHTGKGGNSAKYKVYSGKKTEKPRVHIGLPQVGKRVKGFYSSFQELGTKKQPKLAILTHAAEENVAEIIKIESQYLSALESEAAALSKINDSEFEGGADD